MPVLFIAGAGTDVGKTYVAAALLRALRARGAAVDALKPLVSGFDPAAPHGSDPAVLLDALGVGYSEAALARISPWRFRAPLSPPLAAAQEGAELDGAAVIDLCRARAAATPSDRWLLVESAGGIMSPLDERRTMLDLAVGLGAPVLLIGGSYLGAISHILTAAAVVKGAGLALAGVVLSESPPPQPELGPTVTAVGARLQDHPVLGLARNGTLDRQDLGRLSFGG